MIRPAFGNETCNTGKRIRRASFWVIFHWKLAADGREFCIRTSPKCRICVTLVTSIRISPSSRQLSASEPISSERGFQGRHYEACFMEIRAQMAAQHGVDCRHCSRLSTLEQNSIRYYPETAGPSGSLLVLTKSPTEWLSGDGKNSFLSRTEAEIDAFEDPAFWPLPDSIRIIRI